jgi:hypothetical protein
VIGKQGGAAVHTDVERQSRPLKRCSKLGRAQKTIFIARYLRDRDLQREINEGLNLIEAWNGVNTVVIFWLSSPFGGDPAAAAGESPAPASFRAPQQPLGSCAPPATHRGGRCPRR